MDSLPIKEQTEPEVDGESDNISREDNKEDSTMLMSMSCKWNRSLCNKVADFCDPL